MMTSLGGQAYSHPGGIPHPGAQGHPMQAGMAVPHSQGQVQPGMPQHMQMGVSGPGGPQVSQAGVMMGGGMPPGAGGPSQHALQHLNPQQQLMQQQQQQQQQQQAAMFASPQFQLQQQQQHNIIQQQQRRQAMIQQSYSGGGMPMNMQNGMGQMTPAQFQAMRSGPMARPVNLPQHLQQQQQQAQLGLEQQQAAQAQQQHQQQQHILQQQMAIQNAQQHGGNNPGQQNQMSQQQMHNMQQAQIAAAQQQQQQGQAASASQPSQPVPAQSQPQTQQAQPNAQGQPQQGQPQPQPQGMNPQQQAAAAAMMQQQRQQQGEKLRGQCIMKLMQFADHLSSFGASSKPLQSYMANGTQKMAAQGNKQKEDLLYWSDFVNRFFSPKGVLRHSLWFTDDGANKQYEITYPALARYFFTHFESGVKTMQLIMEKGTEKDLPHSGHYIESQKSSFVYWFDTGAQLIANGTLRAHFDAEQKIELLEFVTNSHEEYLPRSRLIEAARPVHDWAKEWHKVNAPPEGKQSPEMNKKKAKAMKSPPQPPPDIDLPQSKVIARSGIPPAVFRFLELAEVIVQMNPLFNYSHQHPQLAPYPALEQYMTTVSTNGNNPGAQGQNPSGPRTPGMSNFPMGASPAAAHLQLPGSPHIGGSPAQAPGMQLQQSQHGTSSSGPSANTSPNVTNKRRRPSAVKAEEENQVNGIQAKPGVKPSPRIGKRQKPNNAS